MFRPTYISACLTLLILATAAQAAIILVGDHEVQSDSLSTIQIRVQGQPDDPEILGVNLAVEIAGQTPLPVIADVDLITNTIFATSNIGNLDQGSDAQHAFFGTAVNVGGSPVTLPPEGLLATIQINTASVPPGGTFNLVLSSVLGVSTELLDTTASAIPLSITDGRISVAEIPEPATAGPLLAIFLIALSFIRPTRTKAKHSSS